MATYTEHAVMFLVWLATYMLMLWCVSGPYKFAAHVGAILNLIINIKYGKEGPSKRDFLRFIALGMLVVSIRNKRM